MKTPAALTLAACLTLIASPTRAADPLALYDDHATDSLTRLQTPRYTNNNYGYAVTIPASQTAWASTPPAPNHGIRIFLGPRRSIEVEADFDAALLGSSATVARAAADWGQGARLATSPAQLGNRPATRVTVTGPADRRRIVIARWSPQAAQGDATNYVLSLETTAAAMRQDATTFATLVASFRFVPRLP